MANLVFWNQKYIKTIYNSNKQFMKQQKKQLSNNIRLNGNMPDMQWIDPGLQI